MNAIRVKYRYIGKHYSLNSFTFDPNHILWIADVVRKRYSLFAEKINEHDGYIEINLSHSKSGIFENGISYAAFVMVASQELIEEINAWECRSAA